MKYTYFISDLHLGARYLPDPSGSERRVVRFLQSIKPTAERLYLLGDVLDFWFEYKHVVPRGFVRFFGALADLADAGVEIYWMLGNHDIWIFDYLPKEIGLHVIDGPVEHKIGNHKFFLSHGDNVAPMPKPYAMLRAFFRNKTCQWLYRLINPNLTMPFALGWSNKNRTSRSLATVATEVHGSVEQIRATLEEYAAAHPDTSFYIMGHLHSVHEISFGEGKQLFVIGDWISHCTYAVYDGNEVKIQAFQG
ncbi:MAG: UDP-2,3-diacylglucosamine diphosphatase [Muribaculaceae bacterium]|nr:UDP-2,3-diacylglucosamine diphosphatase [Muribaculaceae bacterium]